MESRRYDHSLARVPVLAPSAADPDVLECPLDVVLDDADAGAMLDDAEAAVDNADAAEAEAELPSESTVAGTGVGIDG